MTEADATVAIDYHPGDWVAVVGGFACLLADLGPASPAVARCWELIRAGASATDLLVHEDFRTIGSFAFARLGPPGVAGQLVVRGEVTVELVAGSGSVEPVRAGGVTTWVERALDDSITAVRLLCAEGSSGRGLPLASGVVLASQVILRQNGSVDVPPVRPESGAAPTSEPAPDTPEPPPRNDRATSAPEPLARQPMPAAPGPPVAEPGTAEPADVALDHLFSLNLTGRARAEPEPEPVPNPPAPVRMPVPVVGAPVAAAPDGDAVVDDFGWGDRARPTPGPRPVVVPASAATTSVQNPSGSDAAGRGNTVLRGSKQRGVFAVKCPAGHLNPEDAQVCRVCDAAVPAQEPLIVARPELGVLRLSNGQVITLNRNVLFGRAPVLPDGADERDWNRIMLNHQHISATHLEVRLRGWDVLVTDPGSSNGTEVRVSQMSPRPLQPGDPVPIEPGTEVTMAEEISFRYEVTG